MPIAIPPMVEMLQWHKVHDCDPASQWFRRLLKEAVSDLPHEPPPIAETGRKRQRQPTNSRRPRGPRRRRSGAAL
jgi:hypothetical protein